MNHAYPLPARLAVYRAAADINSLQITFSNALSAHDHHMPPGGFRLAVINAQHFAAGYRLRVMIGQDFGLSA